MTRTTNVWIKFIPFISDMWEKGILKYSVLQEFI